MKSIVKGFLALSAMTLIGSVAGTFLNSCADRDSQEISDAKNAQEFLGALRANYTDFMTSDIKSDGLSTKVDNTRAIHTPEKNDVPLYITVSDDPGMPTKEFERKLDDVECFKDILVLAEETGMEFSTKYSENSNYTIQLSEAKVKQSLDPLVTQSKQYLYSKGFTEQEIQEMLKENNADETELVRLVVGITALENSAQNTASLLNINSFGSFGLFATPAYAQSIEQVGDCALKALGADFLFAARGSAIKTWGKAAIKKAFRAIAQKVLGPVGVGIAVITFGYCMWL